jgi:hypothetical protein
MFQFVVGGRESNTLLDRILITNDLEFQPTDSEPLLLVQRRQTQLVLTWPTNAVGFVVERATSLTPSISWEPVTNVPTIKDRDLTISVDTSKGSQFYHLRRP